MRIGALAAVFLTIVIAGCARMKIHRTHEFHKESAPIVQNQSSFFFGFTPFSPPAEIDAFCQDLPWEQLEMEATPLQSLLHAVTFNIYSPWQTRLTCGVPKPKPVD